MRHILTGAAALLLLVFAFAPASVAQSEWRALITGDAVAGYGVEGATLIDAAEAQALHARGVKFLDARSYGRWEQGHIAGAISLRLDQLEELAGRQEELVFYCGGTDCKLSANACAYALTLGYENVYYFAGGYPAWTAADYAVETGS
ncbi:rhodanese-like domain-containing protein [Candidatus Halocynthiibacter alkanivorans]|jgi:adenylate cyclase|uniref:rhodanese-like domain-containing protein n=1 Tax=Candidatus Halocynthiibacter alkanivorans TaxID=2267619 RepID=UPI00135AFCEF|nr:rhodanese-like domain-containing protein [Candidatus Halocynthiibacter alkanivorans]